MYTKKETDTERSLAVELVFEDIPGGGTVDPDDFQTATETMLEGSILGEDSNGLFHLVKTAELYEDEADAETNYKVEKNHEFKVGDVIMFSGITGSAAQAITAIDTTTSEDYDILTVGTTLGLAMLDGQCLVEATEAATSGNGTYLYTPKGVSRNSVDLTLDNQGCGIVMRGRVRVSQMPYPVDTAVKALLPLINFV